MHIYMPFIHFDDDNTVLNGSFFLLHMCLYNEIADHTWKSIDQSIIVLTIALFCLWQQRACIISVPLIGQ